MQRILLNLPAAYHVDKWHIDKIIETFQLCRSSSVCNGSWVLRPQRDSSVAANH
jgi:hypothetical protein